MTVTGLSGAPDQKEAFQSLIVGAPSAMSLCEARRSHPVVELLLRPETVGLGRRNRLSNFGFYVLAVAGGSGASVAAGLLGAWALLSMLLGRFRFRLEPSDRAVVGSSLLFFLVLAASDLVHAEIGEAIPAAAALLPFVVPLVLVPRMRLSRFFDTLPPAFFGAAVGGIVLIPIMTVEYWLFGIRVQGLSGNPGPLSVTGLLCAGWSILSISRSQGRWMVLVALAGALGGSLAVILSGMRGAWPLLPICLAIGFFAQRRELAAVWRGASLSTRALVLSGTALIFAGVVVVTMPTISTRIDQMWSDLGLIAANADSPTSLNLRRGMYEAAIQAIGAEPWFGYGSDHHWQAVEPYLNPATFSGMTFTHFHNIVLTVGVDAGILGILAFLAVVVAPLVTAWRARSLLGGGRRLAATLILVAAFLGAGMTNMMFFHDILDAVWIFSVSLLAASVPAAGGPGAAGRERIGSPED